MQFARYVLVGGSAFVADFTTLVLLREGLGLGVFWAAALAFLVGMRVNYALATRFVFTERRPRGARTEFLLYAAVGGVSLGLNQLLMWGLTTHLHVHYAVAKPCTRARTGCGMDCSVVMSSVQSASSSRTAGRSASTTSRKS